MKASTKLTIGAFAFLLVAAFEGGGFPLVISSVYLVGAVVSGEIEKGKNERN